MSDTVSGAGFRFSALLYLCSRQPYAFYFYAKLLYKKSMHVSYSHPRYELSGVLDTDSKAADFIYTRRPITRVNDTVLPPDEYLQRYYDQLAAQEGLFMPDFEVLEPTMTGASRTSFDQPRVRISGLLYIKSAVEVMSSMPGGTARYVGGPITPERVQHDIGMSALRTCGTIIMSELGGFILPREQ